MASRRPAFTTRTCGSGTSAKIQLRTKRSARRLAVPGLVTCLVTPLNLSMHQCLPIAPITAPPIVV